jgi:predicted ester cyclase
MMGSIGRAGSGARVRGLSVASRPVAWAALAAAVGGVLGTATILRCAVLPEGVLAFGCSLDGVFVPLRLSRVLTTLGLAGVCLLLAESLGPRPARAAGVAVALLALVTLAWTVAGGPFELSPPWPGTDRSGMMALWVAVIWGKPLIMAGLGVGLLWAGLRLPALLLFALCLLEVPVLVSPLEFLATLSARQLERLLLFLGIYGPGLIGAVSWTALGITFVALDPRLRREKAEEERRTTEAENRRRARRLYDEAWGAGDLPVVEDLVATDVADHRHGRAGREEFKRAIAELHRTFPDLHLSVEEQTAQGDTVKTRCTFSGTDRGGVLWYPPTNRRATFTGTFEDRFSGGMLVEHRGASDTAGLLRRLGLPVDLPRGPRGL